MKEERLAVEALRAGVPNRAAIKLLGTSARDLADAFTSRLDVSRSALADGSGVEGLIVAGDFGAGKSHFLGYLREIALQRNFVVSLVPISKETPLFDPERLFAAAIRGAEVPDRNDDVMTATVRRLTNDAAFKDLEEWASMPVSGLSPLFPALLYVLLRQSSGPEAWGRIARFFGGAKLGISEVNKWLAAEGARKLFDVRPVKAPELALQRLRFAPRLFAAAGYSGWCVLLDEVELVAKYSTLQRGRSYAELGRWLGLPGAEPLPGVIGVCAITTEFVDVVVHKRRDDEKVPAILEAKGHDRAAALAGKTLLALEKRQRDLAAPTDEVLEGTFGKVADLYATAYHRVPARLERGPRLAGETMRTYIKTWITRWDIERLYGERTEVDTTPMPDDLSEDATLEQSPAAEAEEAADAGE
jgi:hypothetical protein